MATNHVGSMLTAMNFPQVYAGTSGPGTEHGLLPGRADSLGSFHEPGISHSQSTSVTLDPALESTIRALLDQQAEIEAKLAALLPQKYGANVSVELDMLRHKLKALRSFASDKRKSHYLVVLVTTHTEHFFLRSSCHPSWRLPLDVNRVSNLVLFPRLYLTSW